MATDLLDQWIFLLGLIVVLCGGSGIILSLTVLIRPVRTLALRSFTARVIIVASIGLISFVTAFILYTYVSVLLQYVLFQSVPSGIRREQTLDTEQEWLIYERDSERIVRELHIRVMIPPPLRQACYESDPSLCQVADIVVGDLLSWDMYLRMVILSSWSVVIGTGLAWYYTRKEPPKPLKASLVSLLFSLLFLLIYILV